MASRNQIDETRVREFQAFLFHWWSDNRRHFPWRETQDPYQVMVAEFMLQQTQAERVVPKYVAFVKAFPSMEELAKARRREVLKHWSGLGYNRRALWLQEACNAILKKGVFPRSPRELIMLRGIGPYTSRSILIFAFNMDLATVDTNIRRILIHEGFAEKSLSDNDFLEIAEQLVPIGRSRDWHNALMDYGALVVTSRATGIRAKSRQSRFKGSVREIRGLLIRKVVERGFVEVSELMNEKELSGEVVTKAIESLVHEGILFEREGKLFLKE